MNWRNSKFFQREKMKPLEPRDYVKIAMIAGIIIVPPLVGLSF